MTGIEILRGEKIKTGDTQPALRCKLLEDGAPFNLTGYTVTITIQIAGGDSPIVDEDATIDNASRGIVVYDWSTGETTESGTYKMEIVASDGRDEITFPNSGTEKLYIEERL